MITILLYEKLIARLNERVPEIKHIDLWNNQIAMEEKELPFNRPAAFIELQPVEWQTMGQKLQEGDLTFTVRILTDTQSLETSTQAGAPARATALQRLLLLEKIWVALHGYQDYAGESQFGKIIRTGSQLDTNSAQLNTDTLTFKTRLTDAAAVPVYDTATFNLRIRGEIVDEITE